MPDRPDIPEEAVAAATRAFSEQISSGRVLERGIVPVMLQAAAPALRNQGAEEERGRLREALRRLAKESVHLDPPTWVKTPTAAFVAFEAALDTPVSSEAEEG
jgi:hypothetical protein